MLRSASRAPVLLALAAALAAGACGQRPTHAPRPASADANATVVANKEVAVPAAPPNPADDRRPDAVKVEDFVSRLRAEQDALLTADAAVLRDARAALASGSQDGAKLALERYLTTVQQHITTSPQVPILAGCFTRARATATEAATATQAMLSDRQGKAEAIASTTFRPWTLPDFGALAGDISAGPQEAAAVKASLAKTRAAIQGCKAAPAETPRTTAASPPTAAPAAPSPASEPAAQPVAQPAQPVAAPPPPASNGTAPPRKPSLLERLKHAFR